MDLAILAKIGPLVDRFQPLIKLADRDAGSISDVELASVARALLGDADGKLDKGAGDAFARLLSTLRDSASPGTKVLSLLGSPEAAKVYEQVAARNRQIADEPPIVYCRCPACSFSFETTLS